MEAGVLASPRGDLRHAAFGIDKQLDRLLIRAKLESRGLLVVGTLGNAPDAAGHLLDLDSRALGELSDQPRVERDLDPMLGAVAPTRLGVPDRDVDPAVLAGLDNDEVSKAGSLERADRSFDAGLEEYALSFDASRELLDRRLDALLREVDDPQPVGV